MFLLTVPYVFFLLRRTRGNSPVNDSDTVCAVLRGKLLDYCTGNTYPLLSVQCGDSLTFTWPAGPAYGVALIPTSAQSPSRPPPCCGYLCMQKGWRACKFLPAMTLKRPH